MPPVRHRVRIRVDVEDTGRHEAVAGRQIPTSPLVLGRTKCRALSVRPSSPCLPINVNGVWGYIRGRDVEFFTPSIANGEGMGAAN
jgi:hypothetical protein